MTGRYDLSGKNVVIHGKPSLASSWWKAAEAEIATNALLAPGEHAWIPVEDVSYDGIRIHRPYGARKVVFDIRYRDDWRANEAPEGTKEWRRVSRQRAIDTLAMCREVAALRNGVIR